MYFRCLHLILFLLFVNRGFAQISVTIPSSPALNINFGKGTTNPGPPLSTGYSDFNYTTKLCPDPDSYSIVNSVSCSSSAINKDAGHLYFGPHPSDNDPGYMMLLNYQASPAFKNYFQRYCKKSL